MACRSITALCGRVQHQRDRQPLLPCLLLQRHSHPRRRGVRPHCACHADLSRAPYQMPMGSHSMSYLGSCLTALRCHSSRPCLLTAAASTPDPRLVPQRLDHGPQPYLHFPSSHPPAMTPTAHAQEYTVYFPLSRVTNKANVAGALARGSSVDAPDYNSAPTDCQYAQSVSTASASSGST